MKTKDAIKYLTDMVGEGSWLSKHCGDAVREVLGRLRAVEIEAAHASELRDEIAQLQTALTIKNGVIEQLKARVAELEAKAAPMSERAAFEAYCQSIGFTLKTRDSGDYVYGYGAELWCDFKAGFKAGFAAAPQAELDSGWIACSERLPPVKSILSEPCELEGKAIPTLYRSGEVATFDGKRVTSGIVEWFHGSQTPVGGITHWMPLPAAPKGGE